MKRRMGVGRIRVTLIPHAEDSLIKVNPNDEMASMIMSTAVRASEAHFKNPFHRLWGIVHCEKRPFSHTFPLKTRERVRERTETRSDTQLECSRTALKPLQVHRSQSHCQDTFFIKKRAQANTLFQYMDGEGRRRLRGGTRKRAEAGGTGCGKGETTTAPVSSPGGPSTESWLSGAPLNGEACGP